MSKPPEILAPEISRKLENKKRVIVYAALFLLAVGCIGIVLTEKVPLPVEKERMAMISIGIGLLLTALFSSLIIVLLRSYATTLRAIVPTLVIGSAGLFLCTWVGLPYFNFALDRSGVSTHEIRFVLKQEIMGQRPLFLAVVPSWKDKKKVITFPVTRQEYDQLTGGPCRITTRSGYFGFEWIVSFKCR
jgi:hypothetical protein